MMARLGCDLLLLGLERLFELPQRCGILEQALRDSEFPFGCPEIVAVP